MFSLNINHLFPKSKKGNQEWETQEQLGGYYNQNTLYACMKILNNKYILKEIKSKICQTFSEQICHMNLMPPATKLKAAWEACSNCRTIYDLTPTGRQEGQNAGQEPSVSISMK